ncbi:hypothetical protein [Plastoroseomonas arctica]|uniref:DUF2268 domain-containing protein n=1 Tax=Plastoroseomonas arctica TaxID=1509237 RepID=A0AAF1JVK2_9PROT|nr:hypothetical protein [Plastoroseomonas arctica]MBR0654092.1 DUF2268 domain-containing protein [Plastoroseomonas arctica]
MRRRAFIAVAGALCTTRAMAQGAAMQDLMPVFWDVFDRHAAADTNAHALAIRDAFFVPQIAAYRAAGIGRVDLAQWLVAFMPMAPEVRRLSLAFPSRWRAHAARFALALPDAAPASVTVLPSFFWFDARVRVLPDGPALFIGPDSVVRVHGQNADLAILLDHESFHLYHHQVNPSLVLPGGDPLWLGIWKEGLAVQACAMLHPGASRQEVLLGDAALAAIDAGLLRRVAREVLPLLGATGGEARARYLSYGYVRDIPARSGYALGFAIAARLAERRGLDLPSLARLPAAEVEIMLRDEATTLAG